MFTGFPVQHGFKIGPGDRFYPGYENTDTVHWPVNRVNVVAKKIGQFSPSIQNVALSIAGVSFYFNLGIPLYIDGLVCTLGKFDRSHGYCRILFYTTNATKY